MILDKEIEVTINPRNFKYYIYLGYKHLRVGELITIPVEDLSKGSNVKIRVLCDICEKAEKEVDNYTYNLYIERHGFYTCKKCSVVKVKNTWKNKSEEELIEIDIKRKQTKLKNHGDENYTNREKSMETCLKIYGVEYHSQTDKSKISVKNTWENKTDEEIEKITNKRIETSLEKHGENYLLKIKEKIDITKEKRYGDKNYNNPEKIAKTKLENHGNPSFVNPDKAKQTNLKNHGVESIMQVSEFIEKQQKSAFKLKPYILSSGRVVNIQGYENLALDILFKKYKENDILIDDKDIENEIGIIFYYDKNNKKHRYYPDFYIISENKIIEVKSNYTLIKDEYVNSLKKEQSINLGFGFAYMVFNKKKRLLTEEEIKELII